MAGTYEATAEYGWLVGGTDEHSLEIWAGSATRVGGLFEEVDSTKAEPVGAQICSAPQGEAVKRRCEALGRQ